MTKLKTARYSWLIRITQISTDIAIIVFLGFELLDLGKAQVYFFSIDFLNNKYLLFFLYATISWILVAYGYSFYKTKRHTSLLSIFLLIIKQFFLFSISIYAFIGVFRSINIDATVTFQYLFITFLIIGVLKIVIHFSSKRRLFNLEGGLKKTIIVGDNEDSKEFISLMTMVKKLNYDLKGVFTNQNNESISGTIEDALQFIEEHQDLDEVYCALDKLTEEDVNEFVRLTSMHQIELKFITDSENYYAKRLETQYYGYLPVLSIKKASLNNEMNQFIKRSFDVFFSLLIIVFILSWLVPLLGFLIKLESKGPVFFKHKRNGINYKEFNCYKFRSLKTDNHINTNQVIQDDSRLTKIGRFIRRTSIDEYPQFFNVFLGNMSVVGPRPHMLPFTSEYAKKIDKYRFTFRHSVKPGITGLAQVKGCRGEVKNDEDIINRIKYDVFYIENWSLLLDLKIIGQTFINIVKGEENAY